ncbi:MAG: hypothetical protein ACR2IJ_11600, partial [Fluviibacter sp.]
STPAKIAARLTENGYEVSVQKLSNWRTRGLSKECVSKASKILGIRPAWLETGIGEMVDRGASNGSQANQYLSTYASGLTSEETELIDAYRNKPRHDQLNVLKLLDIEPRDFAQSA